jgi:hypothetical protein
LFGEQLIRFYVDALTGRVVIRQLDTLHVTAIETDPEEVERAVRYRYAPPGALGDEGRRTKDEGRRTKDEGRRTKDEGRRTKDEGRRTKDEGGLATWIGAQEVLHVAANRVSNALRGRSDLAPLLPWLRR